MNSEDPTQLLAFIRGDTAFRGGRFEEAITWFKQALTERPDTVDILFALGNSYLAAKKQLKAERSYRLALAVATPADVPGIRVNLGIALLELGKLEAAIEQYKLVPASSDASHKAKRNLLLAQEMLAAPPKRKPQRGRR
jgi:Flp pilus assembly protein TadD